LDATSRILLHDCLDSAVVLSFLIESEFAMRRTFGGVSAVVAKVFQRQEWASDTTSIPGVIKKVAPPKLLSV
jgi:hypothetical protein